MTTTATLSPAEHETLARLARSQKKRIAKEVAAGRPALRAELDQKLIELRAFLDGRAGIVDPLLAKVTALEKSLDAAREELAIESRGTFCGEIGLKNQIDSLSSQLQASASELITEFIDQLLQQMSEARGRFAAVETVDTSKFSPNSRPTTLHSNSARLTAFLSRAQSALKAANELKLQVLSDAELRAELDKLRASVEEL